MRKDHKIEEYRTFQIWYDEDEDVFFSELAERYEMRKEPTRKSLKTLKQEIDKLFKINLEFKPFTVFFGEDSDKKIIKIVSVKSDGGLIYEWTDKKEYHFGHRQHISQDSLWGKDYNGDPRSPKLFIINEKNTKLREEITELTAERERIDNLIHSKKKKFEKLDLSFIKDFIKEK